ncbi:MAG: hypothetical protein J5546_04815 [Lachnospiraceae bacterium]|nr:hypothetical protein [Lachnospiraceae bacterium]
MKKKLLILVSLLTIAAFSACLGRTTVPGREDSSIQSSEESMTAESTQPSEKSTPAPESTQKNRPKQITLSGNRDDLLLVDDFCYVEGEKFFLLMEKDICVPGDYADNVALIIDQLEKETGLTFAISNPIIPCDACSVKYGYNPWEDFVFGQKVPIHLFVDRESVGYISCASAEFANIYDYNLFSDELWDSVPAYHDNPWRRDGVIEYEAVAHELTHVLTLRYAKMPKILTEGLADYYAEKVILALADQNADFEKSARIMYFTESVKDAITPETAEDIFLNDYSDQAPIERQDEYTLGRLYGIFLAENYGDTFLKDFLAVSKKAGYGYRTFLGDLQETDRVVLTEEFKKLFGDDVFQKFGEWYQNRQ